MDKLRRWTSWIASLGHRTPEGDFVVDESKFNVRAARSLLESLPEPGSVSVTIHERVAQFGTFGLYRMSATVEGETAKGQDYDIFLGDVQVPQTIANFDNLIYLGGVPRDKANREDVIAHLQRWQQREKRFIEQHAAFSEGSDTKAEVSRVLHRKAEEKKDAYAKVEAALREVTS